MNHYIIIYEIVNILYDATSDMTPIVQRPSDWHATRLPPIHKPHTIPRMNARTSRPEPKTSPPRLNAASCLNARMPDIAPCKRCAAACPSDAITVHAALPALNAEACTGCTGCVGICPADAIADTRIQPETWLAEARQHLAGGSKRIHAACGAADSAQAAIRVPCHATWDAALLAELAAEGVRTLVLEGLHACRTCPLRHGGAMLEDTRREWDALSQALGVQMSIQDGEAMSNPAPAATDQTSADISGQARSPEPDRRAFFRSLLPSLAQGAAVAAAQIGQSAREALREDNETEPSGETELSLRMRLFLRALPHLNPNFTPVPVMDGFPFGAIQATDACTACGDCIPACPTSALTLRPFGDNAILELAANACTGCGLCIEACPEQALERLPAVSLPALLAERPRPMIMVPTARTTPHATGKSEKE